MKTVSFVLTGPPTADMGSFVAVIDDRGERVDVGWWEHDGTNWRYVMPVRMVPELMAPAGAEVEDAGGRWISQSESIPLGARMPGSPEAEALNSGIAARRALKERLAGKQKAARSESSKPSSAAVATVAQVPAPCCGRLHDPNEELLDCGHCGEPKCAGCMPNATAPCADCEALTAGKNENEFVDAAPPAGRLFDGEFHPDRKAVEHAEAEVGATAEEED